MVVGLLGILKAGGAYLPLDPGLPARAARLHAGGRRRRPRAHARRAARPPARPRRAHRLPRRRLAGDQPPTRDPPAASTLLPHNAAYVIYTSGSTGSPRASPSRTRTWRACSARPSTGSTSAPTTCGRCSTRSPSTSRSGRSGAARCTAAVWWSSRTRPAARPAQFLELLARERVTVLNQTPSAFHQLMEADRAMRRSTASGAAPRHLRRRGARARTARRWFARHRRRRAASGQHVRHHRDHRAREPYRARSGDRGRSRRQPRSAAADLRPSRLRAGRRPASRCRSAWRASCTSAAPGWRAAIWAGRA